MKQIEKNIAGKFGLLLTILIVIGVVSVQSTLKLIEDSRLETKSRVIVKKLAIVLTEVTAAETGQRGYIITGDERYLEPYHAAVANIDHEIEDLSKFIRDNPDHQRKLDALKPLLAEKLKRLKAGIDLRKNKGFEAAAKEVRLGKGRLTMDKIRKIIAEIEGDVKEFLKQRSTEAETSANRTIFIIIFGSSLAFVIVGLSSFKTHRELSRRKQIENLLRIKEWAIESSASGIGIADIEGHLTYANEAFLKMFGYDEKEVLGNHFLKFCQKEEEVTEAMEELSDEGWVGELQARRKDGTLIDVSVSASIVKDKDNNPVCMMVSLLDLTRGKQAEKSLESSEANLRSVIERSVDGVVVVDRKGIMRFVNSSAESLFGRKKAELIGEIFGFPIITGETAELDIPCEDKGTTVIEMRVVEIEWKGESAYLLSLRDITDRKRYEESLVKTTEELKRLDQIKSDFISTASHELRTPLASIKNAVDLILNRKTGEITDAQEKFLSMAQRNINRLSKLIDDLLDIARIESGKLKLKYTEVDINDIIKNVINTFRLLASEKSISLTMNIAPDLPPIYVDDYRIVM